MQNMNVPKENTIELDWTVPMSIGELQEHEFIDKGGIYLWIQNDVISYIGEAGCYLDRFAEHFRCAIDGRYGLWRFDENCKDPYAVMRENGVPGVAPDYTSWSSAWDFEKKHWSFLTIIDQARIRDVRKTIEEMRFVLGYSSCLVTNTRLRREIEGGLIRQMCKYHNLPMGRTTAIGKISNKPSKLYHLKYMGDGKDFVEARLKTAVPEGIITSE